MRSWKLRKLFALIVFGVIGALLSFREVHRAAEVPRREGQPSADSVAQSVQRAAEEKDGEPGWWCHSARSRKVSAVSLTALAPFQLSAGPNVRRDNR